MCVSDVGTLTLNNLQLFITASAYPLVIFLSNQSVSSVIGNNSVFIKMKATGAGGRVGVFLGRQIDR